MRFFFYGTLLDPDVFRIVLGEDLASMRDRPAVLPGYRRVRARAGNFPVLVRRSGGRVRGRLVSGLGARALGAIAHFEGPDYEPGRALVIGAGQRRLSAWVFLPRRAGVGSGHGWELARWQQRDKPRLLPQLRRWMAEPGATDLRSTEVLWHVRRRIRVMPPED